MKLDNILKKFISWVFTLLFFLVPLFFLPITSELFEFNKIILVYLATTLIVGTWLARMILQRRILFQKTFLFIPLLLFLGSQIISTIFSIDPHTSLFGYYSRFNGGLLSTISYLLLYWAFVSNCNIEDVKKVIKASLISGAIVSIYGILEHFGYSFSCLMFTGKFNVSCWVQDVKNRVFATLGQPNWLAAYLVVLTPLTWWLALSAKCKVQSAKFSIKSLFPYILSIIFFSCLLFTQSRSGFLGFIVSAITFWALAFIFQKQYFKNVLKVFLIINCTLLIVNFIFGSPFPKINKYSSMQSLFSRFQPPTPAPHLQLPISNSQQDTQIVIGGSESGEIRKIVWKGAINIFKHYPLFGSGVETFAYSYYQFRPIEHNYVSEWDFLYNKAHNEYLNFLATTGLFGLGTYLFFIVLFIFWCFNQFKVQSAKCKVTVQNSKLTKEKLLTENCNFELLILNFALISGWLSILITNFFGFSVVITSLYFFLIPAFVFILTSNFNSPASNFLLPTSKSKPHLSFWQKVSLIVLLLPLFFLLRNIVRMWEADFYYAKGEKYNKQQDYLNSYKNLLKSIKLLPSEPVFRNELSSTLASLAFTTQNVQSTSSAELAKNAVFFSDAAIAISPKNLNLWKIRTKVFYTLSTIDEHYFPSSIEAVSEAIKLSPTDPKLVYNLGLLYGKAGNVDKALYYIEKSIELKPNYADARNALAIYYEDLNQPQKAIKQLEYMQKYIDPNGQEIKDKIERLRKKL